MLDWTCCITVSLSCFLHVSLHWSFFMVGKLQNMFQIIVSPDLYLENWACLTAHTHPHTHTNTHLERHSHCPSVSLREKEGELSKNLLAKGHGQHFCRFISLFHSPLFAHPLIRSSSCESSPSHKQSSYRTVTSHNAHPSPALQREQRAKVLPDHGGITLEN